MAAGYNASSIIGGPLDPDVLKQLERRESVYTKRDGRTADQLLYLNSKTGWVKLSSSVNVEQSSALAKNNVLFGGSYREGSTKPKSGINFNGISTKTAYNRYESIGFRPMPGITGFRIDSKNRFGTLREASIDFQVWSVEQLTEVEQLYLRPGFSVIVEWGHSLYLDNKGRVQKTAPRTVSDYFTGNQSKQKVIQKIKELKKESNQNYDAIFGFIKNFSWSYRTDGGYDCKLTVISSGELIESVKVALNPNQSGDNTEDSGNIEKEPSKLKTPLHNFLQTINSTPIGGSIQDRLNPPIDENLEQELESSVTNSAPVLYDRYKKETGNEKLKVLRVGLNGDQKSNSKDKTGTKQKDKIRYIRIKDLLALINVSFLLEDEEGEKLFKFNLEEDKSVFLTFPDHIALDPKIAVLPKVTQFKDAKLKYEMSDRAKTEGERGDSSILNIYLSINYILGTLDSVVGMAANSATVLSFVEGLLNGLTDTLGNINEFGLHYEEEEFMYYVVDRRLTPNESDVKKSLLNVTGLKSTVTNISLSSKLSPNIASMIAISAQASNTDVGEDVENMFRWNEGLEDRIVKERNVKTGEDLETKKKRILANVIQLARGITIFNSFKSYNKDTFDGLRTVHRDVMQFLVRKYNNSVNNAGAAGIIPFDLDITLDGIGGVKIGQAFTINEGILPSKYNGVVGFLITGVSHVVQNNKWNTDLKAQTIIIGKPSKIEEYETDELLGSDALQAALVLQKQPADPTKEFVIINQATDNGKIVDQSTHGKIVSKEYVLKKFLNQNSIIQKRWSDFFDVLYRDYKGYKIRLTGVYRSMEAAIALDKAGAGASPGTSPHIYGGALDFNIIQPDGTTLLKKDPPQLHELTGIPGEAQKVGMYWAGYQKFSDGVYDTVHYQARDFSYKQTYNEIINTARADSSNATKDDGEILLDTIGDPPIYFDRDGTGKVGKRLIKR